MPEHWCKEHQTWWFKKGQMRDYAHPILDGQGEFTGKWCHEPKRSNAMAEAVKSRSDDTNISIEAQVAIKEIGLNLRAGLYTPDNRKLYPEIHGSSHLQAYDRWIQSRTLSLGKGEILLPVPTAEEEHGQKETTNSVSYTNGVSYPRNPQSLQTIGGLMNALREDTRGSKLTIPIVENVLSMGKDVKQHLGDTTDIPGAYRTFMDWHRGNK